MTQRDIIPNHPGRFLKEKLLEPMQIDTEAFASALQIPHNRVNEIISCVRDISPDTALRLGAFFEHSPEFWLDLQLQYDLAILEKELDSDVIKHIKLSGRSLRK